MEPDNLVVVSDSPVQPWNLNSQNLISSRSCPNFTKLGRLSRPYSKVIPKRSIEKDQGISGNFTSCEVAMFGQERGKLKIYLLVAILRDWDVLRHNLYVLANPKEPKEVGNLVGKANLQEPFRNHRKTKLERGKKLLHASTQDKDEITSIRWPKRVSRSQVQDGFQSQASSLSDPLDLEAKSHSNLSKLEALSLETKITRQRLTPAAKRGSNDQPLTYLYLDSVLTILHRDP